MEAWELFALPGEERGSGAAQPWEQQAEGNVMSMETRAGLEESWS